MSSLKWRHPLEPNYLLESSKPTEKFHGFKIPKVSLKFMKNEPVDLTKLKKNLPKGFTEKGQKFIKSDEKELHKFLFGTLLKELNDTKFNTVENIKNVSEKVLFFHNKFHSPKAITLTTILFTKLKHECILKYPENDKRYIVALNIANEILKNKRISILKSTSSNIQSVFFGKKSRPRPKQRKKRKSIRKSRN
jgi:hypothetical protein